MTRVAISPLRSFNPRTPCGVRLGNSFRKQHKGKFQSTHSLRSATVSDYALIHYIPVSIHALLAECDCVIQPRYPLHLRFQSTHSLRSATVSYNPGIHCTSGFNPRTPCGVRLARLFCIVIGNVVSIHALLAECDAPSISIPIGIVGFNPRTPCGVRPVTPAGEVETIKVSIHALLAECDLRHGFCPRQWRGFNPRTPCGVRPCLAAVVL